MKQSARYRFGFHFVLLARIWRRRIDAELARAGLTDASWAPLIHLDEGGDDISQSELADRVGLDGSSLVRLIDLLEARKLVERRVDPADRRARRIVLTVAGREEIARLRARIYHIEAELLVDLGEDRLAGMLDDFAKISARLQGAMPAPDADPG